MPPLAPQHVDLELERLDLFRLQLDELHELLSLLPLGLRLSRRYRRLLILVQARLELLLRTRKRGCKAAPTRRAAVLQSEGKGWRPRRRWCGISGERGRGAGLGGVRVATPRRRNARNEAAGRGS